MSAAIGCNGILERRVIPEFLLIPKGPENCTADPASFTAICVILYFDLKHLEMFVCACVWAGRGGGG
jgi:hypothetical protein